MQIPNGPLRVGSKPGSAGRQPRWEPSIYTVELGSFEIDRLPYPNDPNRPPLTGVSRDEAKALCAQNGSRLCTELEWERACKGPNNLEYATGDHFEAVCLQDPKRCSSGFGVIAMGVQCREWTASELGSAEDLMGVSRGSTAETPDETHRCAARTPQKTSTKDASTSFRCCRGAPNAARLKEPALTKAYQKVAITPAQLSAILKEHPTTAPLADSPQFFKEPDAADAVVEKGGNDRKGLTFSVSPVLWNPSVGVQMLLLVGHSAKDTSYVLAYNVIAENSYTLAASFIMKNEQGPVALAFDDSIRTRLFFSTCWGCPGETGKILFREPESAAILQP